MPENRFIWNQTKNEANLKKHGISFENAARVFFDPLHLSVQDRIEGNEERWQTIGMVGGVTIILVAHTFRADGREKVDVIRIISARRATAKERKAYEEG